MSFDGTFQMAHSNASTKMVCCNCEKQFVIKNRFETHIRVKRCRKKMPVGRGSVRTRPQSRSVGLAFKTNCSAWRRDQTSLFDGLVVRQNDFQIPVSTPV